MSLPSFYYSGDDEEELFRLTDPSTHPNAPGEDAAFKEDEWLSSSGYDDKQDECDEQERLLETLVNRVRSLSADKIAEVLRLIQEMQDLS